MIDPAFAKTVTDMNGKDHILIAGRLLTIDGPAETVNPFVEAIVSACRRGAQLTGVAQREAVLGACISAMAEANGVAEAAPD